MNRHDEIKNAYKSLGGEATFYDGMITCSTLPGKAVCKLVWNMDKRKNEHYLNLALAGIPEGFGGKMLEVPVGTGVLSMPVYETLPDADITCLDYSPDMMERAKRQAEKRGLKNVHFMQGDVGKLPFSDSSFDLVWRMALASLWVLPVSFGIILATAGIMRIRQEKVNEVSVACSDGIQECLETLRDLKANNAEAGYLEGLDKKIKDVEKYTVTGELTNAVFHTCGRMVLKLGIATTVLVGGDAVSKWKDHPADVFGFYDSGFPCI